MSTALAEVPRRIWCAARPWANPFVGYGPQTSEQLALAFRQWIDAQPHLQRLVRMELGGHELIDDGELVTAHAAVLEKIARKEGGDKDPVMAFGSNLAGRHGRGAAWFAREYCGAQTGVGEGRQGQSYAIATKDADLKPLPLEAVCDGVKAFIAYALEHPDTMFEMTRIGCGLAGFKDHHIAPLFEGAPPNVDLPATWRTLLGAGGPPRVIVAGSRDFVDQARLDAHLDALLERMSAPVIVSGGARGADTMGERYAMSRGWQRQVPFLRFPARWERFGNRAGMVRNQEMSRASTHLVAFWDGRSRGTAAMIDMARADGLAVRVVPT